MNRDQSQYLYLKECPVCSSPSLFLYKKATFDFSSLNKDQIKITDSDYGKIWNLSCCQNCTHIFANPCPSPEFIHSLYSKIEDPLYQDEASGRSKNFDRILSLLEKIHPEKGALFDVGAATGILLQRARQRGWQPDGIEASSWAVKTAQQKYKLQLIKGDFEKAPIKITTIQQSPWLTL